MLCVRMIGRNRVARDTDVGTELSSEFVRIRECIRDLTGGSAMGAILVGYG